MKSSFLFIMNTFTYSHACTYAQLLFQTYTLARARTHTHTHTFTHDERLVALKLSSLSCLRNRSDLIPLNKVMHNLIDTDLSKLFHLHSSVSVSGIVTRGYSLKLYEPIPRLNICYAIYMIYRFLPYWPAYFWYYVIFAVIFF